MSAGTVLVTNNAFLQTFTGVKPNILPLMAFYTLTAPMPVDAIDDTGPLGAVLESLFRTSMRRLADGR